MPTFHDNVENTLRCSLKRERERERKETPTIIIIIVIVIIILLEARVMRPAKAMRKFLNSRTAISAVAVLIMLEIVIISNSLMRNLSRSLVKPRYESLGKTSVGSGFLWGGGKVNFFFLFLSSM